MDFSESVDGTRDDSRLTANWPVDFRWGNPKRRLMSLCRVVLTHLKWIFGCVQLHSERGCVLFLHRVYFRAHFSPVLPNAGAGKHPETLKSFQVLPSRSTDK